MRLAGVVLALMCAAQAAENYVDLVNPFVDTHKSRWFFFASAGRPFGMVKLSPDTQMYGTWDSGYLYNEKHIRAFSHIHDWQVAGVPVMPATGAMRGHEGFEATKSAFSHDKEIAKPGYHKVVLEDYGITAELTSTKRVGFHRYRFPAAKQAHIYFDAGARIAHGPITDSAVRRVSDRELAGMAVMAPTNRRKKPLTVYFVAQMSRPFVRFGGWRALPGEETKENPKREVTRGEIGEVKGRESGAFVSFTFDRPETVLMKVAISYVSEEQARVNLKAELAHWDFDRVVKESYAEWNDYLGRIDVQGGTREQRVKLYTDLWHSLLGRGIYSDANGKYTDNTGAAPRVRQVPLDSAGRPVRDTYNSDSFWGSHWTLNVLWPMAWPKVMNDQAASLIDYYSNGGMIARGPSGGNYTFVMIGDQAVPVIAAAYFKGIRNFDLKAAYEGSKKNAFVGGIRDHAG
ncbi:MAG: glycoside hydrolase family 92 protein, partial [Bryobacteraceae bacterium]|nr:glycoside hydrolase family 92 protein [Bryobacteraceae bacterium]